MSVIRVAKRTNPYAQIPNDTLRDNRLSLAATGLLSLMLSYADGWEFNYAHLTKMKTNGRDAFRSAMKELVTAGYVKRTPRQNADGTMAGWEWEVFDTPTGAGNGADGLENRLTGNPSVGEADTKNTNGKKTKENLQPSSTSSTPSVKPLFAEESKVKAAKPTTPVASSAEDQASALMSVYNANCGALPSVQALNPKRLRYLMSFIQDAGGFEKARTILERATKEVARDEFWLRSKKYGLDNLLAGGKVFQRAEAYQAQHEAETPSFSVGDHVRFKSAIGRIEEGVVEALTDKQAVIKQDRDGRIARIPIASVSEVIA